MIDRGAEQRRGDTDTTVPLVHGEADHPPRPRILREHSAECSVALHPGHLRPRHDATPPDGNAVDVREHAGWDDGGRDLGAQGLPIVPRARTIGSFEQSLAPAPARIVAAATERNHDIVPALSGRRSGLDLQGGIHAVNVPRDDVVVARALGAAGCSATVVVDGRLPMDLMLTGKRVIVTGASRGIGRAIAEAFLDEGARVAICARDAPGLAAAAAELGEHGEVHQRSVDMSEPDGPAAFVEWAVEQLGGLDVVVSNVSAQAGNDYAASFQVDIEAANSLIRAALAKMADHDDANIVFIGSRAGNVGVPWMPAYAAVKAATVSMAKSLALEVARRGIRVNVVSPGDVLFPGGSWDRAQRDSPKLFDGILRENPLRRLGRPEEIADVVAFVASPRASFVTGANIMADGGATRGLQI